MDERFHSILKVLSARIDAEHDLIQALAAMVEAQERRLTAVFQAVEATSKLSNSTNELLGLLEVKCERIRKLAMLAEEKFALVQNHMEGADSRSLEIIQFVGSLGTRVEALEARAGR